MEKEKGKGEGIERVKKGIPAKAVPMIFNVEVFYSGLLATGRR